MPSPTNKRPKRSPIWKIDRQKLVEIVAESNSLSEILKVFNLSLKGGNSRTLQNRLLEENIDISHIKLGLASNKGRTFIANYLQPLEELLVENSSIKRGALKKRLLKIGLLKNQCYICGQLPEWNGKPLVLQIDHINGVFNDNRIENLRILCPHCHSQTDSFAGRNLSKQKKNAA